MKLLLLWTGPNLFFEQREKLNLVSFSFLTLKFTVALLLDAL